MKTTGVAQHHGLGRVLLVMLTSAGLWAFVASSLWPRPVIASVAAQPLLNLAEDLPEDSTQDPYLQASRYVAQGRYRDAIAPYEASLARARTQAPEHLSYILGNLAIAYRITGQYPQALATNQELIQLLEQRGQNALLSKAWGNQGNVYLSLGDYDQAQTAFEQGQRWAVAQGDRLAEATLLASLGTLAAHQGQTSRAGKLYEQAFEIAAEQNQRALQSGLWLNLGAVQHSRRQFSQAQASYQAGLDLATQLGEPRRQAEALASLGVLYDSQRDFVRAMDFLQRGLALFQAVGDRPNISVTLNNLGHAQSGAGQLQAAEASLRQALLVLDELRRGLSDLDKVSLFDTQTKTYNLLQQVLTAQGRSADALVAAEWGRARAFADLLSDRLDKPPGASLPSLSDASAAVAPPSLAELQRIARDRRATLVVYSLVPEEDFLHQGKQLGIPEALYIWVVEANGQVHQRRADLKPLIAQQQPLELLVRAARCFEPAVICKRRIKADWEGQGQSRGGFSFNSNRLEQLLPQSPQGSAPYPGLQQLHQLLIEPIAELLPQEPNAAVIVVPQGELFLVPFAALQNAQGEFLIQRHTLLMAPSIQTLALTQRAKEQLPKPKKTAKDEDWLVVGNPTMPRIQLHPTRPAEALAPLPGSEREAIAIAQILQTQPLLGDQALETTLRQRLPQARGIHLATHGLLSYGTAQRDRRLPGAMVLAAEAGAGTLGDGLLTSEEILALPLQAELVVLSACDTGRGALTGDGVVGLARAWMGAGVPSVVMSLWAVPDDSTAALMTAFYGHLSQGMPKAQALRQAMLATAKQAPNPLDWSAFVLMGEDG